MEIQNTTCDRCERLPRQFASAIDLYLSAPVAGTRDKILMALHSADIDTTERSGVLKATLEHVELDRVAARLSKSLSASEQHDTRALVVEAGSDPGLTDFIHMQSLESVIARIDGEHIVGLLADGRLVTYLHPIVDAKNTDSVFAYECLTRGLDPNGSIVPPNVLFGIARRADVLFYLDRESRMTSLRSGAGVAPRSKLFVNFNPGTIYSPEYCLRSTMRTLDEVGLTPDDVVFEVVESDRVEDVDHLLRVLDYYRERGFEVALDDLGAGFNSLTSLSQLRPDYMKLDIDLVRDVDRDPFREAIVRNLLALARDLKITTIAEGIEREGEYLWVRNAGADYLQGYYFARPEPADQVIANLPIA
ncbi:MAG: EAL domain-containing protein [Spirochaetota bacterium]